MDMLDVLNVKGAPVTCDAMNAQKKIAHKIPAKGGDYTLCIKANHKRLHEEISAYFHKVRRDDVDKLTVHEEVDAGHGRVEQRRCRQLRVTEWISEAAQWSGAQTVIEMERSRHLPGQAVETRTQYYISSLPVLCR